jgi:hypothetical protein
LHQVYTFKILFLGSPKFRKLGKEFLDVITKYETKASEFGAFEETETESKFFVPDKSATNSKKVAKKAASSSKSGGIQKAPSRKF